MDGYHLLQVSAAAKKPVVLVTMTAVPLDLSDILANPKVGKRTIHFDGLFYFFLGGRNNLEFGWPFSGFAVFFLKFLCDFTQVIFSKKFKRSFWDVGFPPHHCTLAPNPLARFG